MTKRVEFVTFSCLDCIRIVYCRLNKLAGGIPMLAECIVALGTMLIPLAIVLLTTVEDFSRSVAYVLMVLGVIALISGIVIAVRQEMKDTKREKRRRRIDKSTFIMLTYIAEQLGVDMDLRDESDD